MRTTRFGLLTALFCFVIAFTVIITAPTTFAYGTELEEANARLEAAEQASEQAQVELDQANVSISAMEAELAVLESNLARQRKIADSAAVTIYRSYSTFDMLLTAALSCSTISEFLSSIDNAKQVYDGSIQQISAVNKKQQALEDKRSELEAARVTATDKLQAAESAKQQAEVARTEARKALLASDAGLAIAQLAAAVACTAYPNDVADDNSDGTGRIFSYNGVGSWNTPLDSRCLKYKRLVEDVKANSFYHTAKKGWSEWYGRDDSGNLHYGYDNSAWASCHQAATAIVRAAVDKDIFMDGPGELSDYIEAHPEKWIYVGDAKSADDPILKPGDIVNQSNHTALYVGNEIAREFHPGTTGSIFEASYSDGGSYYAYYPGITTRWFGTRKVFRFIGTPDGCVDDITAYF